MSSHSFLRVRTPSSRFVRRQRPKKIARGPPPPPHVTRVSLTHSSRQTGKRRQKEQTAPFFLSCLPRCEGAGEHQEGSVLRPSRGGAQTGRSTPTLLRLVCRHCHGRHRRRRRRRRRRRWRRERRKQKEWSGQKLCGSRNQEDGPAQFCLHQSSGERELWEGEWTTLDVS